MYKVDDINVVLDDMSSLFSQPDLYPGLLSCKVVIAEKKLEISVIHPEIYLLTMKYLGLDQDAIIGTDHERNHIFPLSTGLTSRIVFICSNVFT